ncbi:xanthine dehydrogenase family protein molybdopterin-binding subunit [Parvibaculum sp.]|jgi:aerobic carbon-monoxide dehydrogenase large subunit|uniref:xanthine dehydrogenase family protein molybdopterin-binding subunit n=1 Tax=Parvibaculum sp. TaxID=2024848 RepID=UPI000C50DD8F|nr:xanthine dehydrogenase family protein molybdopterin-binding subunit [Parvibaculum sp.]MAM93966.1 carbon monoxide dehydrogenase [Parvibaculum sp.]
MVKFGVGQPARRVEDMRLVTGQGRYTDDISLPGQVYAVMVRSPHSHAKITGIDAEDAKMAPGVLAIYTGKDAEEAGLGTVYSPAADMLKNKDGTPIYKTTRWLIAKDRVRHVGDLVAMVVAETPAQARDAADLVMVDYEDLPAVSDTAGAIADGAPVIWEENGSNLAYDWTIGDAEKTDAALKNAHHITRVKLINNRIVVNAMEPRAALGNYEAERDHYTLYTGSQGVHGLRNNIAQHSLKIPVEKLRVVTEDVGGGFGMKTFVYPEYPLVLFASKMLGRPVKWTADRSESFISDTQGRDHVTEAALALDKDGKILGVQVDTIANLGAYQSQFGPFIPSLAPRGMHVGVYMVPAMFNRVRAVYTNTVPVDAYRGAGRPEASYVIERLMEKAAREMNLAPDEIRRRNFVPSSAMPLNAPPSLPFDSGDFERNLNDAMKKADVEGFAARKSAAEKEGKLLGLGYSYYVERTAAGMADYARIAVDGADGMVHVWTGQQTNGQGHETAWTQLVSSRLGIDAEKIKVHLGDSEVLPGGAGTGGSKALYMAGGAIADASDKLIEKGREIAANELEAAKADIEYRGADGEPVFAVAGTDKVIDLFAVAKIAEGQADLGEFAGDGEYTQKGNTFPNGAHICEVEIEADTGVYRITRFTAVDDFGQILNPLLVAGQVHGGIVQGLGQAMGEHAVYDANGQLVTGSFMDYWMPRAADFPDFNVSYNEIPARSNALGVKGAGEAGTVGAPAAFINAMIDALVPYGVEEIDMPVTPLKLWNILQKGRQAAE